MTVNPGVVNKINAVFNKKKNHDKRGFFFERYNL